MIHGATGFFFLHGEDLPREAPRRETYLANMYGVKEGCFPGPSVFLDPISKVPNTYLFIEGHLCY